jgi:hypothetical protein
MTTPGSFLLNVGEAIGLTLMMAAWIFIYVLVLMAPFYILYRIMCILARLAGRIRRGRPRP